MKQITLNMYKKVVDGLSDLECDLMRKTNKEVMTGVDTYIWGNIASVTARNVNTQVRDVLWIHIKDST